MKLSWAWRNFENINGSEMHEILSVRQKVFILEQQSLYPDADQLDHSAWHLMCRKETDRKETKLTGYARVIFYPIYSNKFSLGRILVAKEHRKQGIGRKIIQRCITQCVKNKPDKKNNRVNIKISAQTYLTDFYQEFGFQVTGDTYDDAGVEHIDMLLKV